MKFSLVFIFLIISLTANSQKEIETDLLFYGDVMINAFEDQNRIRASKEFSSLFEQHLESNPMLNTKAEFNKYISILDLDKNRKLVTWQVKTENFKYDFMGYFLEKGKKPIEFTRTEALSSKMSFMTCTEDDWYGCIYMDFKQLSDNQYIIFGRDPSNQFDNQKVADILTINGENSLTFGAPIFEDKKSRETFINRIILSYSSDASVFLHYHKGLNLLLHDHLEPRMGLQAGQGATNIPDGTYEGYEEKNGKWMYVEKIFNHVYEDAPIPKPTQSGLFKKK